MITARALNNSGGQRVPAAAAPFTLLPAAGRGRPAPMHWIEAENNSLAEEDGAVGSEPASGGVLRSLLVRARPAQDVQRRMMPLSRSEIGERPSRPIRRP